MPADFSMLSGLFKGMADRQKGQQAREQQSELFTLQKEKMKFEQQQLKLKAQQQQMQADREARIWKIWEDKQAEKNNKKAESGTGEPPKFGKSFQEEGLTDKLAGYGVDPFMGAMGGPEMQNLYENDYKERDFARKQSQDEYSRMKDASAVDRIPVNTAQGSFVQTMPKYPGLSGQSGGMMQTGPPPVEMTTRSDPETGMKYQVPINKVTGQEAGQRTNIEPLKGESAEASAKIALANQGLQHTKAITGKFINPDGSVNRKLVLQSNAPMGGVGEGRQVRATFLDALDARARAATGAAMPDSEVANYTRMYFPSVLDDDKTIKDKLKRLNGFLKDYMEALDPSGLQRKRLNKKADFVYNPATGKLEPVK